MSLRHILLGMLSRPHSGYDLKKQFNQSLRNFWNAELSQIYPQLQKLEKDGLLTSKQIASSNGPPRRVYTRSDKGRRELLSWLANGPNVGEERISYLAQVFFLSELTDTAAAIRFMQELRDHMMSWLESLQEVERRWQAEDPRYPDALADEDFYPQLTLALGLRKVRCNLDWCDECIARLKRRCAADFS
ncbi:MAG: PadR family transcriptional regulator [Alphaproteobacteria bacterium]|nr:PadR family transcriptional regulator [Alphaproteobacteria bacterium]